MLAALGTPYQKPPEYSTSLLGSTLQSFQEPSDPLTLPEVGTTAANAVKRLFYARQLQALEETRDEMLGIKYDDKGQPVYNDYWEGMTPERRREVQSSDDFQNIQDAIQTATSKLRGMDDEQRQIEEKHGQSFTSRVEEMGTQSMIGMVPSLATLLTTRNVPLAAAMQFPLTEAQSYANMRIPGPGVTPVDIGTASDAARNSAAIDALVTLAGAGQLIKPGLSAYTRIKNVLATDLAGGAINTIGQTVNESLARTKDYYDPKFEDIANGLEQARDQLAPAGIATFATSPIQSGLAHLWEMRRQASEEAANAPRQFDMFRDAKTPDLGDIAGGNYAVPAISMGEGISPVGRGPQPPAGGPPAPPGPDTIPRPATTGSPAPEGGAGEVSAPGLAPPRGTATTPKESPLSSAFQRPAATEPAAPPASPASQEPASTPAPQAVSAVSTKQEPPAGGAASQPGNPQFGADPPHLRTVTTGTGVIKKGTIYVNGVPIKPPSKNGSFKQVIAAEVARQKAEIAARTAKPATPPVSEPTQVNEPSAGEAALLSGEQTPPIPVEEEQPETKASLDALRNDPNAHVRNYAPDHTGSLVPEEAAPPWRDVGGNLQVRQFVQVVDGNRYPIQEIQTKGNKRYARGYDTEGKPLNAISPTIAKIFDQHFGVQPTEKTQVAEPAQAATTPAATPAEPAAAPAQVEGAAPAPAKPALPPAVQGIKTGKRETVTTAAGRKVDTEFEVHEARDLITSDHPSFPKELQPRERGTRLVSQEQVSKMGGSIDPALLGSNPHAEHGAPIIGSHDNLVESGNARMMAIRQMYARDPTRAQAYRDMVASESGQDVSHKEEPVLVRRRLTPMTDAERVQFAKEANKTAVSKMSAGEQAKIDQEALTPSVMGKLPEDMDEGFDLSKGDGDDFVNAFVAQFPPSERGELVDADGKPSPIAVQRAKAALLQKAYGGTPAGEAAIRRAVESTSTDAQTLVSTLIRYAAPFAKLRDDIAAGRVQDQADIGEKIAEAIEVVRGAKGPGGITNWLNTEDLLKPKDATVKQLLHTFYSFDGRGNAKRLRPAAVIADTLGAYLRIAQAHAPEQAGGGLFGGEAATPVLNPAAELGKLNEATRSQELTRERQEAAQAKSQQGLFDSAGESSGTLPSRTGDEGSGQETQAAGLGESGNGGSLETRQARQKPAQVDFLEERHEVRRAPQAPPSTARVGPYTTTREGEITASRHNDIWTDNNLKPTEMNNLPPPERYARAAELVREKFGFREITKAKDLTLGDAIDIMKDAYVGLTNNAAVFFVNPSVMSLDGTLGLELLRQVPGKPGTRAYYDPATKTIAVVRRNDSYTHELGHAIDHMLLERFAPELEQHEGQLLSGKIRTGGGVPQTMDRQVRDAFVGVLNAMFFDNAGAALRVMELQNKIATAKTDKQRAKWQEQLDNFIEGHSKKRGIESDYYKRAKGFDGPKAEGDSSKGYWQKPTEMFARAFEAFAADRIAALPADHPFATKSDTMYKESRVAETKSVFPLGSERDQIFQAMDVLMGALRDRGLVSTGNAPTAIKPTDQQYWKKQAPNLPPRDGAKARNVLARIYDDAKTAAAEMDRHDVANKRRKEKSAKTRAIRLDNADKKGLSRMTTDIGMSVTDTANDLLAGWAHTTRGSLLSLDTRYPGNPGLPDLIRWFVTDPGKGTLQGPVFGEEVRHRERTYQNRLGDILENHEVHKMTTDERMQLRDVLVNSIPSTAVAPHVADAAAALGQLRDDLYVYNTSNGVNIGYAKNGFLPRVIDSIAVEEDPEGFMRQAKGVYSLVFDKEIGSTEQLVRDPARLSNLLSHVDEIARDGKVPEAKAAAAELQPLAQEIAALQQQMEEAGSGADVTDLHDELEAKIDELRQEMRPIWATEAAADWHLRVSGIGARPEWEFESRGVASKYTKGRVLPPETDTLMRKYLKNDAPELLTTYISQTVRRVEYGKMFGNPEGDKPLGWKLRDALTAMKDPYVAANGETHRISTDDAEFVQKSIELMTGIYNTSVTKRGLRYMNSLAAFYLPVVLMRSLGSQIAEPLAASSKMAPLDGFRVIGKQFEDLLAGLGFKGPEMRSMWRRELGEYMGIVTNHLADNIMASRYNVLNQNSADKLKLGRFFYAIGVHPHAMSMRRALGEIALTRYLPGLAKKALGSDKAVAELAKQDLAELGIDSVNEAMLQEVARLGDIHSIDELSHLRYIDQIRSGLNRKVLNMSPEPSAVDKPRRATLPETAMLYAIQGFNNTFWRYMVIANAKRIQRAWANNPKIGAAVTGSVLAGMFMVAFGQLANWIARVLVFDDESWDGKMKKIHDQWFQQMMTRTSLYGAIDPMVNSIASLKWQKGMADTMIGPIMQQPVALGEAAGKLFVGNSPYSPSAEYNATKAAYNGFVVPAATAQILKIIGRNPYIDAAFGIGLPYLTSPAVTSPLIESATEAMTGQEYLSNKERSLAASGDLKAQAKVDAAKEAIRLAKEKAESAAHLEGRPK